jgi:hypothetical protein
MMQLLCVKVNSCRTAHNDAVGVCEGQHSLGGDSSGKLKRYTGQHSITQGRAR